MTDPNLLNQTVTPDTLNEAGGLAYKLPPKHALAQLAATGCLAGTYYTTADQQMEAVLKLVRQVEDNLYLAKLAVYSRERAQMKDMPVALTLALARRDRGLFRKAFARVVDNGRTLRTFVRLLRGGQFGRKGLSYSLQKAVQGWLNSASVNALVSASIGHDPSLRDVMRLARPTPPDDARRALYGWLTGSPVEKWAPASQGDLPAEVQDLMAYRRADSAEQQVEILTRNRFRWDLLADAARGPEIWKAIARQMGPQALRMNLNTLVRHGVLADPEMISYVAGRIADPEEVRRSRQLPYQFFAAYLNSGDEVPTAIRQALESAAEVACGNVPELPGPVVIGLDVSGSMGSPVTGTRGRGQVTKMRCVDVAALFAAAVLRRNPDSVVLPFDTQVHNAAVSPQENILSLAARLARYGGGGTNCSLPIAEAASGRYRNRRFAGCILVSDNESWVGEGRYGATAVLSAWQQFLANQARLGQVAADLRLICIDIQPHTTTQAPERADILNVGGFSDAVFDAVAGFLRQAGSDFVAEIEAVEL